MLLAEQVDGRDLCQLSLVPYEGTGMSLLCDATCAALVSQNLFSIHFEIQLLISEFLSLNDNDAELEQNKELILAM